MSPRAQRRQYAILGALHEHGPQSVLDLAALLHRGGSLLNVDLDALRRQSLVVGEWEDDYLARTTQTMPPRPPAPSTPRRRIYRVTDAGERDRRRQIHRDVEQEIADLVAARRKPRRPWRTARPEGA